MSSQQPTSDIQLPPSSQHLETDVGFNFNFKFDFSCKFKFFNIVLISSAMPLTAVDISRLTVNRPWQYANSSTEEEEETGKGFLESRKAKRTGAPARPSRRTITTGRTGTATKPYDQAKWPTKSRRQGSAAQNDDNDVSGSSSDSSSSSSTSASPRRSTAKSKSNNGSDSEATVETTTNAIQTMNPGLSDAELLTAWREAGGRLFESIQELIDVKKMIYHGIGERLIEERKRECGREYYSFFFIFLPFVSFHGAQRSTSRL
jgi:hypothetical protein